jgi:hypothetical protein
MWWISTLMSRKTQQFPPPGFKDVDLNAWLVKESYLGSCNINYFIHINFKCLNHDFTSIALGYSVLINILSMVHLNSSWRRPFLKSLIAYYKSLV